MRERTIHSDDLLKWYDANARDMPWRIAPERSKGGEKPDPYHIWLSEVMLQQTTVAAVHKYFVAFTSRWPDVHALANATDDVVMGAWAGLGYYARARNLLKCARHVSAKLGGTFPEAEADLRELPGIGPYTAAAISAIAFGHKATVVDANVERVISRIYAIEAPLPDSKGEIRALSEGLTPEMRAGDYAQAVMDLGATICAKKPECVSCPWSHGCSAFALGNPAEFPRKRAKPAKPVRHGIAYLARRDDGEILLETRPNKGLLGGMLCLPSSDWVEGHATEAPPIDAKWRDAPTVKHTFTHFHLILDVKVAQTNDLPSRGHFVTLDKFDRSDLPTVMRKAYDSGISALA